MNLTNLSNRAIGIKPLWMIAPLLLSFLLISCKDNDDKYESPQVSVEQHFENNTIPFDQNGGVSLLTLNTNRAWRVETADEWIKVSPSSGNEGRHNINILVHPNSGVAREGGIRIVASGKSFFYTITQKSVDGKDYTFTPLSEIEALLPNDNREGIIIEEDLTIRAVVVSDYRGKQFQFQNFHYIVDTDGNGIVLTLDKSEKPFEPGDQITVNIKGCKLVNYNGTVQLTIQKNKAVVVPNKKIEPINTTIAELNQGKYHNVLVRLPKVQFEKYENEQMYSGTFFMKSHKLQDPTGTAIDVEVMKNSTFGSQAVPAGSGSITAIVTVYKKNESTPVKYSLKPSLYTDMQMSGERFSVQQPEPNPNPEPSTVEPLSKLITIGKSLKPKEFRDLTEAFTIDVVVTANNESKQLAGENYHYVQDEEGTAMALRTNQNAGTVYPVGTRLLIAVKGAKLSNYFGTITFDVNKATVETKENKAVEPKVIGAKELKMYQDKLVKISDVQLQTVPEEGTKLENPSEKHYTKWMLIDKEGNTFQFEIKKGCSFGGKTDFVGSGSISGIVTVFNEVYSIRPRTEGDIQLKGARF
ncbi:DUF5689 domain-containing protein [Porphyromonas crevioricanis]|uniref:DUF5689 domain-containing protein n=1 Tax=Porphyromonas crevioricanis TaxID=393921 RepID=UPI000691A09F|nr:DUF5689 domain-containing protein [Porphyromonas crevioricanis]